MPDLLSVFDHDVSGDDRLLGAVYDIECGAGPGSQVSASVDSDASDSESVVEEIVANLIDENVKNTELGPSHSSKVAQSRLVAHQHWAVSDTDAADVQEIIDRCIQKTVRAWNDKPSAKAVGELWDFCDTYDMQKSFGGAYSRYGREGANNVVSIWGKRLAEMYVMWKDAGADPEDGSLVCLTQSFVIF